MSPSNNVTVLLVSQPGIMHDTLRSILQSLPPVRFEEANGALTAYDLLEAKPIDAMVIDGNIPLAERIALLTRAGRQFPNVCTIVLTTTAKHHQTLNSAGAHEVLTQHSSSRDIEQALFSCKRCRKDRRARSTVLT